MTAKQALRRKPKARWMTIERGYWYSDSLKFRSRDFNDKMPCWKVCRVQVREKKAAKEKA